MAWTSTSNALSKKKTCTQRFPNSSPALSKSGSWKNERATFVVPIRHHES